MLFNSLDFAFFFGLVFTVYALVPRGGKTPVLLAASLYAYGSWNWNYLALVVVSAMADYWLSWRIYAHRGSRRGRLLLTASILYNLSILCYFKYANMLGGLLIAMGLPIPRFQLFDEMPVGISFFTFQSMGYTFDVWRGRTVPARSLRDYLLFVSFFPQMVSGPIERANGLLRQIERTREVTPEGVYLGLARVAWGLFQKVVIADNLALCVDAVFTRPAVIDGPSLLIALMLFAAQLYADFAGYCDIAIGIAQMLGFRLSENFRGPEFSRNASDVWYRWNITLMAWFRDYVYFPLAGRSWLRSAFAVLVVFTLSGLWHGPAWHFAFWGLCNGLLLLAVRAWHGVGLPRLPAVLAWLVTVTLFLGTLLFFRSFSIHQAVLIAARIATNAPGQRLTVLGVPWEGLLGFAALLLVDRLKDQRSYTRWFASLPVAVRLFLWVSLPMGILLLGAKTGVRFLYVQF